MVRLSRRTVLASAAAVTLPRPASAQPEGVAAISEASFVRLGGMDQWVTIRGQDRRNPMLLILPGGPGGFKSDIPVHFQPFERSFTVVQWDQPGTGKTYAKDKAFGPEVTLEKIASDGVELCALLQAQLGNDKLVLLGESFGSITAMNMLKRKPDVASAYVGVGQVVSFEKRAGYLHDMLLRLADEHQDAASLTALKAMKPPFWADLTQRRDLDRISRNYIRGNRLPPLTSVLGQAAAPGWAPAERVAAQEGGAKSGERFRPVLDTYSVEDYGCSFQIPIAVIQGEDDHHTPTPVSRRWLASISAPRKAFAVVPDGRHTILSSHPMETLRALEKTLRPWGLAGGAVDPAGFDRLAGRYQINPGMALEVSRRGDALMLAALGQSFALQPETARTFLLQEFDAVISFEVTPAGAGSALTLQAPGVTLRGARAA